jgi:hypothetical protein
MKDKQGNEIERIKMIVTILERGKADLLIKELRTLGVTFNMASVGYSAGGLDLADYFGLHERERDIVFSVLPESKTATVLSMIEYKFSLDEPGKGIACCVPISGVGGPISLRYISGIDIANEDAK